MPGVSAGFLTGSLFVHSPLTTDHCAPWKCYSQFERHELCAAVLQSFLFNQFGASDSFLRCPGWRCAV